MKKFIYNAHNEGYRLQNCSASECACPHVDEDSQRLLQKEDGLSCLHCGIMIFSYPILLISWSIVILSVQYKNIFHVVLYLMANFQYVK